MDSNKTIDIESFFQTVRTGSVVVLNKFISEDRHPGTHWSCLCFFYPSKRNANNQMHLKSVDFKKPNMNKLLPAPNIDPVTVLLFWTILSLLCELHDDYSPFVFWNKSVISLWHYRCVFQKQRFELDALIVFHSAQKAMERALLRKLTFRNAIETNLSDNYSSILSR